VTALGKTECLVPRSHPPTLLTLARRCLREECALERGQRVLVAVSGGPDSMALLHVLSRLGATFGIELVAHGVDHGLRAEAASELDLAERFAKTLDVPFARTRLRVPPGGNLQARAREQRYAALREAAAAAGATVIATAHHADDRAETFLIRLLRGASPGALAVLPARDGDSMRPLIRARRADVLAHLTRHEVPYAEDPSNRDHRFVRVRVREEILPLLESLSPRIVEHLNGLADELGDVSPLSLEVPDGSRVHLGRVQRAALRRLLAGDSPRGRIRLRGGWEIRLDPLTGALRIAPVET